MISSNGQLVGNRSKILLFDIEGRDANLSNCHNQTNTEWAISGQHLLTGEVVYLSSSGWVSKLTSARVFDAEVDLGLTIESIRLCDQFVLFPDKLGVSSCADGLITPNHFREAFRATGPSNRFHGKQTETEQLHHV